jgi:hypothetical protein
MRRLLPIALLGLLVASPLRAFTPESGFWWAPNEPGSGIALEIQDNFLFLAAFVFDNQGFPTYFTAQGLLTGNARFLGQLTAYDNGQCIGCPWRAPRVFPNRGPVEIIFDTEYLGRLRWGGREIPIERFDFYLSRSGNQFSPFTEMMLGEWQAVLDLSSVFSDADLRQQSPYFGEVMVFDLLENAQGRTFFDGCRPDSSLDLGCSSFALAHHDAAGYFDAPSGLHVIVVKDVSGSSSECPINTFAAYFVEVGTYKFDGDVEFYCQGQNPTGQVDFPVRGYRSASRAAVQDGVGPSAAKQGRGTTTGISSALPAGWSRRVKSGDVDPERRRLAGIAAELTERIATRSR